MSNLPDFNPTRRSRAAGGDRRWFDEEPEPLHDESDAQQGSEGELQEARYTDPSGRCGWLKQHKWKVLLLVLVLIVIIVLCGVLIPRGGGDDKSAPAQVSGTNTNETAPTLPPAVDDTSLSPSTVSADDQESPSAPTVLFSPAGSPAQAPFVFELASDVVLTQFGEVFGYAPDGETISLASAVSGDGNTVALMNRIARGNSAIHVSVYRFNGEWRKLGEDILGTGDISINGVGQALALSHKGNALVIGFFNAPCDLGVNCGMVQVHAFKDGAWSQLGTDIVGEEPNIYLGLSVEMSRNGQTIAIGAPYNNGADGQVHLGKVKVLRLVESDWKAVGTDIEGDEMRDQLGSSVSLSADGNVVACGAPQGGMPEKLGYVKVAMYDESTESFAELGSYIAGREGLDQFGVALALSDDGTTIAISAFDTKGSGAVCVFMFEGVAWIKVADDIESPIGRGDLFGYSVDIDAIGGRVAIGAPDSEGLAGAAYLFQLEMRGWKQRGEMIRSSFDGVQLGRSVSISAPGMVVSPGGQFGVQTYYDSGIEGPALGLKGFQPVGSMIGEAEKGTTFIASTISGDGTTAAVVTRNKADEIRVSVYRFAAAAGWTQMGEDITGTGSIDAVGKSVALSETGAVILIGFYNEACDAGENCGHVRAYSYEGNAWKQLGQDIVGTSTQAFLGWSVAMSNDGLTIAVGSPTSHGDSGTEYPGKVKVFIFENTQWIQVGTDLEGDSELDHLGSSVALSSNGAFLASGAVQAVPGNLGYVKVFGYDPKTDSFIQLGENLRGGDNRTDKFGDSVAFSDDGLTLVVGANTGGGKDDAEARLAGQSVGLVTVFSNENNTWTQVGNILESGRTDDMFGHSVAIDASGSTIAVGAPQDFSKLGSAYVYYYDGNSDMWLQHGEDIYLDEGSGRSQVGRSVALSESGTLVAVGSSVGTRVYQLDFESRSEGGAAPFAPLAPFAPFGSPASFPGSSPGVVFASPAAFSAPFASPVGVSTVSSNGLDQLGGVVGIDANAMSISSTMSGDGSTTAVASIVDPDVVRVRVFRFDSTSSTWTQIGGDIIGTGELDGMGKSLALSENGDTIVIGFFNEDCDLGENCGHVRVYSFVPNDWKQLGEDIVGAKTYGFMGWSVAVSNDGSIMAIGAAISHGETISHAGKVRVFRFQNATWNQLGTDLEGDAEWDNLGGALSLSGNGTTIACGAVQGVEGNLGYVKVFQYVEGSNSFVQRGANIVGDARTDRFGEAVSLSEDGLTIAVGGTKNLESEEEENPAPTSGLVSVFQYALSGWVKSEVDIESGTTGDLFGYSVAMNNIGSRLIVGAPECKSLAGCALIFENNDGVWTYGSTIHADVDGVPPNQLGRSVAISKSGDTVAAGGRAGMQVYKASTELGGNGAGELRDDVPSSPLAAPAFSPSAPVTPSETTIPGAPVGTSDGLTDEGNVPSYLYSPSAPFAPALSPVAPAAVEGAPTVSANDDVGTPSPVGEPKGDAQTPSPVGEDTLSFGSSPMAPFAPAAPFGLPTTDENTNLGTPAPVGEPKGDVQTPSPVAEDTLSFGSSPMAPFAPAAPFGLPTTDVNANLGTPAPVSEPEGDVQTPSPVAEDTLSDGSSPMAPFAPAAPFALPTTKSNENLGTPAPVVEEANTPQPILEQPTSAPIMDSTPAPVQLAEAQDQESPAAPATPFAPASPIWAPVFVGE